MNCYTCDRTHEVAFELAFERKERIRRKGVQAAETEGANPESHKQVTQAWPGVPHSRTEGGVQEKVSPEREVGTRSQSVSALLRSGAKPLEPVKGF